jgi:hypothetical protein
VAGTAVGVVRGLDTRMADAANVGITVSMAQKGLFQALEARLASRCAASSARSSVVSMSMDSHSAAGERSTRDISH